MLDTATCPRPHHSCARLIRVNVASPTHITRRHAARGWPGLRLDLTGQSLAPPAGPAAGEFPSHIITLLQMAGARVTPVPNPETRAPSRLQSSSARSIASAIAS
jgi:hypothetical protein